MSHSAGNAAGVVEPLARPAVAARAAAQSLLTAVTSAGGRLVAVGERGIVLLSDDAGVSWRQAAVPVSVTLTAVSFPTPDQGWAVGHGGVVLHSGDGGERWVQRLDGETAARLALEGVQARTDGKPPGDRAASRNLAEARQLVADGPDKPFLDLYFESETRGFVVGAYNLVFRTDDGGRTWQYLGDRTDNPMANHIYAITGLGDDVYLAGEQGLVLRTSDGGESFSRLETPYDGSYFAVATLSSGDVIIAGLRGNAYRSADRGRSWNRVDVPAPASVSALKTLEDGTLLLANEAGQIFRGGERAPSLTAMKTPALAPVLAVEPLQDGSLVVVGVRGVTRVPAYPGGAGNEGGGS